jgi:hypothetical protein
MTWTILIILVADMRVAEVPFRDPMMCGNALPVIHNTIAAEWPDAALKCEITDVPIVRPRARLDQ